MITKKIPFLFAALFLGSLSLVAHPQKQAGPKGGRLLDTSPPAEFFINAERKIELTFLHSDQTPLDPGTRTARITALAPTGRTVLELEASGKALLSEQSLPEGDGYTIVVQLFEHPEARPQNFRILYEAHTCGGCDLAEYACTCDH